MVYRCRQCGYILYVFWRVGQNSYGVLTPSEVISMYGGVCPRCGHPLRRPGLQDLSVTADRDLVRMRVELLKQELEDRRKPRLLLHVPVRHTSEVTLHG